MPEVAISDLVEACVKGEYEIPEFQREFIWKPKQVVDFADSLSQGFPVGCLVVWQQEKRKGKHTFMWLMDNRELRHFVLCLENAPAGKMIKNGKT